MEKKRIVMLMIISALGIGFLSGHLLALAQTDITEPPVEPPPPTQPPPPSNPAVFIGETGLGKIYSTSLSVDGIPLICIFLDDPTAGGITCLKKLP